MLEEIRYLIEILKIYSSLNGRFLCIIQKVFIKTLLVSLLTFFNSRPFNRRERRLIS